ncbi:tail fiber domain-containing protein [uncultured Pedobacter sp.]|uniref:tail fiber domain-containing protein n=1 Tax=uncultured Pedobacter sp. TaxID=246139 RepID=UPI0025E9752F|nr:tail fiber domain-containing protein [uncultured Pedobacter sp.]
MALLLLVATSMYGQQRMGDNLGNHKATNNLDMNGKNLNRVQVVNAENVVIGTASAVNNASISLQVNGQKAILIPRVTNLLDATNPAIPAANLLEGMMVYDLTTHKFYIRDNNSWITYGSTRLADANILVGDATGTARSVAMTGDVTISNAGVTAIGASKILTPMIADANVTAVKLADSVIAPSKMKVGTAANQILRTNATNRAVWANVSDLGFVDLISNQTIDGVKTFSSNGGLIATGSLGQGTVPTLPNGVRMSWIPNKGAFQVGLQSGTEGQDSNIGLYSFAAGSGASAKGVASVALGINTLASGNNALAVGNAASALGLGSVAIGSNVSSGANAGSFVFGDNHTVAGTSGTNDAANQMLMRFRGGYKFVSAINASNAATKGLTIGADGTASYIANARALFTPLSLVDKGYVDSLSAAGPFVSRYLAQTVAGQKTFKSDSGFVAIGTNGNGIIPVTGAGTRMMFYPGKSAFRVGQVTGTQWDDSSVGAASTALGYNTTASGANSIAMGSTASALAQGGVAIGSNVSTGAFAGSFAFGDNNTAAGTSGTNDAANQMLMRFRGGYKLVSAINASNAATKGLTIGANGVATYLANARALFTPLSLVDKGYVDSLSAAGPFVSRYLAQTVVGQKIFKSDSGFVAIGTNGAGIIPVTGAGTRMMFYSGKSALRVGQVSGTQWDDTNVGTGSIALGYDNIASGSNSVAIGANVSTGSFAGSFAFGDNNTAAGTSGTNDAANQMLMRFRGGYKFVSAINASNAATKGLTIGANGVATYLANARALFTPLSLVDKGYVDSLSAAGPFVSRYLAQTVVGQKTFKSDSGFVAIGTNGAGIIPATGAGSRMMFYPGKSAFRVGQVTGTQWDDASIGAASTALGYNTTASGANSIAMGNTVSALAQGGVALGSNVSTGSFAGSFVFGDNNTAVGTSGTNDAANQMLMRFRGGYKFVSAINASNAATKGLTIGANGVATYLANARALFTSLSLVDKGYVDSLSAAGPFVSRYLAQTVAGQKTFKSDSGFVAIGTNGTGIIPVTGAGTRMMFYPGKSAFRVGQVTGTQWDDTSVGSGSVALGYNTIASGSNAVAAGSGGTSSGNNSFSYGTSNSATDSEAFAGGGLSTASGARSMAVGLQASASGTESFALGKYVTADAAQAVAIGAFASTNGFSGAFALGDGSGSSANTLKSLAANQMVMRFAGGYRFYTSANLSSYVDIAAGANGVSITSDRRKKENFEKINGEHFLSKIDTMQLSSWNYKGQDPKSFRHYGPMAQDFYQAFGKDSYGKIGNDTTISSADIDGVNMIAIQALIKRTNQLQEENRLLAERNHVLVKELQDIKDHAAETFKLVNHNLDQQRKAHELQLMAIIELLKKSNQKDVSVAAAQVLETTMKHPAYTNPIKDR